MVIIIIKFVNTPIQRISWKGIKCINNLRFGNLLIRIFTVSNLIDDILHILNPSTLYLLLHTNYIYSTVVVLENVEVESCLVLIRIIIP